MYTHDALLGQLREVGDRLDQVLAENELLKARLQAAEKLLDTAMGELAESFRLAFR